MKPDRFLFIAVGVLLVILLMVILLGGLALLFLIAIKAGPFAGNGTVLQKTYDYNGTLSGFDHVSLQVKDYNGFIIVREGPADTYDISVDTHGTQSDYDRYGVVFGQSGSSGTKMLSLTITDNSSIIPSPAGQYSSDITITLPADKTYDLGLTNANGLIDVGGLNCGALTMSTANGDLTSGANATSASYNTFNGRIDIRTGITSGSIDAGTDNGGVSVTVPQGAGVSLNARLTNGRISTDLPIDVTSKGLFYLAGNTPGFSNGLSLNLSTLNGDISVNAA
jgi:hypothetical protein